MSIAEPEVNVSVVTLRSLQRCSVLERITLESRDNVALVSEEEVALLHRLELLLVGWFPVTPFSLPLSAASASSSASSVSLVYPSAPAVEKQRRSVVFSVA